MSQSQSSTHTPGHKTAPRDATSADLDKLKALVKEVGIAMLSTIDSEGKLHSRPMGVNGEMEVEGGEPVLYFFTYGNSPKVGEMNAHDHQCNLAFAHPGKQSYISVSGTGQLIRDRAVMEKRWNPILSAWFPKGLDEPDCALLRVVIVQAEYWDSPSSIIAHAISFAKAKLTGTIAAPGDHEKLKIASSGGESSSKVEKKEQTREEGKMQDV